MISLSTVKNSAALVFGRGSLYLKFRSPEIMLGIGILGVVTSTVMACKATLELSDLNEEVKADFETLEYEKEVTEEYQKEKTALVVKSSLKYLTLYLPAAIVGTSSLGLIVGSHSIMAKRNAAMAAAYNLLDSSYKAYRARVIEDGGQEKDDFYRYGVPNVEDSRIKIVDAKGKELEPSNEGKRLPISRFLANGSIYSKWFSKNTSRQWRRAPGDNLFFLQAQQNFANDKLQLRGHVFLNEVYDSLGLERTKEGAVVGWVLENPSGDSFIDFNLHNPVNTWNRDYADAEEEEGVFLDFNVDGLIYDII